jgi:hypothetical protein
MRKYLNIIAALTMTLVFQIGTVGNLSARSNVPDASPHEILQKATTYLKTSQNLELEAEIEFDILLSPTLLAQYDGELKVLMSRPNRLFVAYRDGFESKKLWFDGNNVTYLDVLTGLYAKVPGKETIEETVFELSQKYGLALPLAKLLFSDSYSEIAGSAHSIDYLGKISMSGATVHHIVARGEMTDIQVWIESDGKPVIRKMVIINHSLPFAPRYIAKLTKFERPEKFAGNPFSPVLPELSHETKMLAIEGSDVNAN